MGEHVLNPIQQRAFPYTGRKLPAAVFTVFTGTFDKISDFEIEFVISVLILVNPGQW